jgi:hypothetical protein
VATLWDILANEEEVCSTRTQMRRVQRYWICQGETDRQVRT